jgi:tripartite-type tricarboxylate transporter receptor subunit TctC
MDRYKTPEADRRLASVVLASGALGRPMLGTPGIPADRVKILRNAFQMTMKDPEFLAEIEKRKFELDPTTGEELDKIVKDAMGQPPEIIGRMKKFLAS